MADEENEQLSKEKILAEVDRILRDPDEEKIRALTQEVQDLFARSDKALADSLSNTENALKTALDSLDNVRKSLRLLRTAGDLISRLIVINLAQILSQKEH